jgi:very-short-patch-repair endonuclease
LRLNTTDAEKKVWKALREAFPEAKFRRQVPLGSYFADFCSHSAKLVIEIDGGQHGETVEYDAARTRFINNEGYQVIRFWNNDVMDNIEGVMARIQESLSPCGRG